MKNNANFNEVNLIEKFNENQNTLAQKLDLPISKFFTTFQILEDLYLVILPVINLCTSVLGVLDTNYTVDIFRTGFFQHYFPENI